VDDGVAVLGLLNKYLGPAALESVKRQGTTVVIRLPEPGVFGAYLAEPPRALKVDGETLSAKSYTYSHRLLRIPRESFNKEASGHEITIYLAK
jgi:hypothetical protein